ncbi:unnamed protein product, partial [Chrysoparadoxa australica]
SGDANTVVPFGGADIHSLSWHPTKDFIAAASYSGWIRIWNSGGLNSTVDVSLFQQDEPILDVAWSTKGNFLAMRSYSGEVIVLEIDFQRSNPLAKVIWKAKLQTSDPTSFTWSQIQETQIFVGSADGKIYEWEVLENRLLEEQVVSTAEISSIYSSDIFLASAAKDGKITVWNTNDWSKVSVVNN